MSQVQAKKISQELNLLKIKLGLNIPTNFRQEIKEYLEQQLGNVLSPDPKKASKELIEGILRKFVKLSNEIFFNLEIKKKLEKNQEITLEDIEWQLERIKTFELWLRKQMEGYLILKTHYYRQRKQTHQAKSEEYKKMVENCQKSLNFVRQERKEIMQEVEDKKKESKELAQKIIKDLKADRKIKEKGLVQAYEEWANDPEEWTNEEEAWADE